MLSAIYNMLWYPALPFALIAAHPASMRDYRERMGHGDFPDIVGAPRIWIHAASVGEIEAIRPVAIGLLEHHPGAIMTITTMTVAGRDAAMRRIPGAAAWMLAPLDNRHAVRSFLDRVQPGIVLITETEIWPNYFLESARSGAKIAVVNGRISERSMRRYMRARGLFRDALGRATLIMAQSQEDATRYAQFDLEAKIVVTGNTKIEAAKADAATEDPIRPELMSFASGRKILIAGSTAPGEEAVIADAYRELRKNFPRLALTIAPRHLDRTPEVENTLRVASLKFVKASELNSPDAARDADVLILDTMGELRNFYRRGAIAFVGGSLAPGRGGQSPAEPALVDVPVLIGPHHENQQEMVSSLVSSGGARIVKNADDIVSEVSKWLGDDAAREAAGRNAHASVSKGAGGAQSALKHLEALISLG
ncbi:3-deoxy-D-manno-octulosonic acid transferase [Candidatus Binatus sp.]|uniref:3-deoxy-D-manno-octulosonic acid transferase n=1 Tax=Candidatus Binatus sp. TaxID=2811406 RepID=UPI003BB05910